MREAWSDLKKFFTEPAGMLIAFAALFAIIVVVWDILGDAHRGILHQRCSMQCQKLGYSSGMMSNESNLCKCFILEPFKQE